MKCWTFLTLLLLSSFGSFAEEISDHVHVAANDHWMVFARNRDENFHLTISPYRTPAEILHLNYSSLGTETVRSLSIPARASSLGLIELLFIGGSRNGSERILFHVKLRENSTNQLSLVHLTKTSITSLSSVGIDSALGMHPLGTYAFVIGDQAGLIYDLNQSRGFPWSSWEESINGHYPKAVSVTLDNYIFVGANVQLIDTIVPALYIARFDPQDNITAPLDLLNQVDDVETTSIRALMSLALLGSVNEDYFAMIVGFASVDAVLVFVLVDGKILVETLHQSKVKGVNFGQRVIFGDNQTYGVLSSAFATSPWSTGRVEFYRIPTNSVDSYSSPEPIFVYPNNQQHFPYRSSTSPSPFHLISLFSWTDGFGVIISRQNVQRALLLPASPPGSVTTQGPLLGSDEPIIIISPDRCLPGTYKSKWGSNPCELCPERTVNNGSSGIHCDPCGAENESLSTICFRGASQRLNRQRWLDREQTDAFPDSPDWTEFDDVLLNHVFQIVSISDSRCLTVAPIFWGSIAIAVGVILFLVIVLLGCFSKMIRSQTLIKHFFTHLDLIGEGKLWLGGLVTLAIVVLIALTCKFSASFTDLYPFESISSDTIESVSCDSNLINAKFSSSLKLLSTRKHAEEKPIFDMLDEQNITLMVEFISTGFQCSNVSMQQNLARGQIQKISHVECSYEDENDILIVSSLLPQHLITVQVNLQGPFFVGGLRVCLSGPETVADDEKYTVKSLDFCHFVYTPDQLLSVDPVTNIEMTKVINRTAAVSVNTGSRDVFSGRWLPTWTTDKSSLWDSHIYTSEQNEYRRSLNWQLELILEMRQSKFYMNNVQEPIARGYEIVFKTVLFSMLFLDLFGLLFLIVKVAFVPLLRLIQHRASCCPSTAATAHRQ